MAGKIRVLVVDDSALVRQMLTHIIGREEDMRVVGCAGDPLMAREMVKNLQPDVLTLDIEMPRMDGLEFLSRLMRLHPLPVVMISSLTEKGADATMRALELGAVDFVPKPRISVASGLEQYATDIVAKIRAAARSRVGRPARHTHAAVPSVIPGASEKLILIGASTGGTEAIKEVLVQMPAASPPILVVQHMPVGFTTSFARRLDGLCRITVKEGEPNERVLPGHAYIAPGGKHMKLRRNGAYYLIELSDEHPYNLHRPSVDMLFLSAAPLVSRNASAALLTGMGKDGARGLLALKDAGVHTIAQSEASSVVFGMPREAIALGAADVVADLADVAGHLLARLGN